MGKRIMLRLLLVGMCSLAVILIAKEFREKETLKVCMLTDYPDSTWYSEQTGDMIEVGEDFEYEDEMPGISITKEYRGERIPFFLFHSGSEYWILFDENERETEVEGIRFTGEITNEGQYTYVTFYDFAPMGKDSAEGRNQITEMFGSQGEVVFKKVPNQHFDQYPDSIWKSEEMGYTLVVPDEKDLEEDGTAEFWVEQEGVKERYGFYEPLYDAHAWGEIYDPKQEEELEDMDDFYDYLYCSILILEENNHLYMELSNFEAEKECPAIMKKYFMQNPKITLEKVK